MARSRPPPKPQDASTEERGTGDIGAATHPQHSTSGNVRRPVDEAAPSEEQLQRVRDAAVAAGNYSALSRVARFASAVL